MQCIHTYSAYIHTATRPAGAALAVGTVGSVGSVGLLLDYCRNCRTTVGQLSEVTVGRTVRQLSDSCRTVRALAHHPDCRTYCRTLSDTVGHCRTLSDCRTVGLSDYYRTSNIGSLGQPTAHSILPHPLDGTPWYATTHETLLGPRTIHDIPLVHL